MRTNDPYDTGRLGVGGGRGTWPRRAAGLAGVLAVAAVLAGACSHGSSGPGVANAGSSANASSSPGTSASSDPLAFARCMRAHGVADFPDSGNLLGGSQGGDLNPNNPTYRAARQACQSLRPVRSIDPAQQAQTYADGLQFAQCMRGHGITNYPDPDPRSGTVDLRQFDPNSPQFQAAQQACRQYQDPNGKGGQ